MLFQFIHEGIMGGGGGLGVSNLINDTPDHLVPFTSTNGALSDGKIQGDRGNPCTARYFQTMFPLKSPQARPLETPLELGDPN